MTLKIFCNNLMSNNKHLNLINSNAHPNYKLIDKEIDEKIKQNKKFYINRSNKKS